MSGDAVKSLAGEMKIIIWKSRIFWSRKPYRFRIVSGNGERVAQSQGYTTSSSAWETARAIRDAKLEIVSEL